MESDKKSLKVEEIDEIPAKLISEATPIIVNRETNLKKIHIKRIDLEKIHRPQRR